MNKRIKEHSEYFYANCHLSASMIRDLFDEIERLSTEGGMMREALERLARLGAGDQYGNSDGNRIAQEALRRVSGVSDSARRADRRQK